MKIDRWQIAMIADSERRERELDKLLTREAIKDACLATLATVAIIAALALYLLATPDQTSGVNDFDHAHAREAETCSVAVCP